MTAIGDQSARAPSVTSAMSDYRIILLNARFGGYRGFVAAELVVRRGNAGTNPSRPYHVTGALPPTKVRPKKTFLSTKTRQA
jgi:hypothetical protein